jgi:hypothetical protein
MIYLYEQLCITFHINVDICVYRIKLKLFLSPIICVKEYLNLQYLITNIIIRYSEIIIENNYKYYNKEKYIIILNHITNIKTYLTFCAGPLKRPIPKITILMSTHLRGRYKKSQY